MHRARRVWSGNATRQRAIAQRAAGQKARGQCLRSGDVVSRPGVGCFLLRIAGGSATANPCSKSQAHLGALVSDHSLFLEVVRMTKSLRWLALGAAAAALGA